MSQEVYLKKMGLRKLKRFQEYEMITFALWVNGFVAVWLVTTRLPLWVKGFYVLGMCMLGWSGSIVKTDIMARGDIGVKSRRVGLVLILYGLFGNFFSAIAGFTLIQKRRSMEYTLLIYAILINVGILAISALNLFKPYVADTFIFGISVLVGITGYYLLAMAILMKENVEGLSRKVRLTLSIPLMLSLFIGNLFAFSAGLILLVRVMHKRDDVSIEWIDVLKRLFRNYMSVLGLFVISLLFSLSICSFLTFDYAIAIDNNYSAILQAPSIVFPFGTDNYGRCNFTRIVFGARISLLVGFVSTAIPIVSGGLLGAIAGYYGGKSDNVIMRLLDIVYAVPGILLAIAIVAAFGASTTNLIFALSIGAIPIYARTIRATVMSIAHQEFIEAAKACGAKDFTIITKHIIPNAMAPMIVRATLGIGGAVLATSSLSYLGLGVEPHIPEWGNILKIGSSYLETAPNLAIYPGLAIILIVLAFNYFGDGLRDAMDPKLK